MENKDCIFCKIIKGEIPSFKIYENEFVYAFLDISKDCYGHTLVVPKCHAKNIFDCDDKYLAECIKATKLIANHYKNDCSFDGVNILNASGKCAEQSVFHLHFHIMPRKENDNMKVYPELASVDTDLAEQVEFLRLK